jgi:hypothetical protein
MKLKVMALISPLDYDLPRILCLLPALKTACARSREPGSVCHPCLLMASSGPASGMVTLHRSSHLHKEDPAYQLEQVRKHLVFFDFTALYNNPNANHIDITLLL